VRVSFTAAIVAALLSWGTERLGAQAGAAADAGRVAARPYHPLYIGDSTWAALDTRTIARQRDGTLSVWISWDYLPVRRFSFLPVPADHMMQQQDVNCARRRMRARVATYYAPDGTVLGSYRGAGSPPWMDVVPASIGEAVLDEVCAFAGKS
jgi:hypothetical protein